MDNSVIQVSIDEIDLTFKKYKISRNHISEKTADSIKRFGVIEPVYLIRCEKKYKPVIGHNRIECAISSGLKKVPAVVDDKINREYFLSRIFLKLSNDAAGPCGKIRLIKILKTEFDYTESDIDDLSGFLSVPSEIRNSDVSDTILSLPEALLDYIDYRDIPFKTIMKIIKLDKDMTLLLSQWASGSSMKLNIFRAVTEMMYDLKRAGLDAEDFKKITPENFEDKTSAENAIHDGLFTLRYPDYSAMLEKTDRIRNSLAGNKITAEIPRYFEGGQFFIKIAVDKKSGFEGLQEKLAKIRKKDVEDILSLL